MAVNSRKAMLEKYRRFLVIDEVDVTSCFEYELLPSLLPPGDPAREDSLLH